MVETGPERYRRIVMNARFLLLIALAPAVLSACSSSTTPTPGSAEPPPPPPAAPEAAEGTEPAVLPYTEAEIQTLFDTQCLRCHGTENTLLDLTAPFAGKVVGVAASTVAKSECGKSKRSVRVVAGDREASLLWHKVKGTHDCGEFMPPSRSGIRKLNKTELERVGLWIDALPH
jgi:hypothetical protein